MKIRSYTNISIDKNSVISTGLYLYEMMYSPLNYISSAPGLSGM